MLQAAADWVIEHLAVGREAGDAVLIVDETSDVKSSTATVILSSRVSRGRNLRRSVMDSVADGTLEALPRLFHLSGSLPDRTPADRCSPSARAS